MRRFRLSYANVVATLALIAAVGGGAGPGRARPPAPRLDNDGRPGRSRGARIP